MLGKMYECKFCGRNDFETPRALSYHQNNNKVCSRKREAKVAQESGYHTAMEYFALTQESSIVKKKTFAQKGQNDDEIDYI